MHFTESFLPTRIAKSTRRFGPYKRLALLSSCTTISVWIPAISWPKRYHWRSPPNVILRTSRYSWKPISRLRTMISAASLTLLSSSWSNGLSSWIQMPWMILRFPERISWTKQTFWKCAQTSSSRVSTWPASSKGLPKTWFWCTECARSSHRRPVFTTLCAASRCWRP